MSSKATANFAADSRMMRVREGTLPTLVAA